jgi:hypothetical protein
MNTVRLNAWVCSDPTSFAQRKTVGLTFQEVNLPLKDLLTHRVGFETDPVFSKGQYLLDPANPGWGSRVSLVITDTPQDIYGMIDQKFIASRLKLPDLISHANELDITISQWSDVGALSPDQKALLFARPIMSLCQRERRSEEQILGFKRISWEEFGRDYVSTEGGSNFGSEVFIFPRQQHNSYEFSRYAFGPGRNRNGEVFVSIGDHMQDGKEYAWIQAWRSTVGYWTDQKQVLGDLVPLEDIEAIQRFLATSINSVGYMRVAKPKIDFSSAPSLLTTMKYNNYFKEQTFDLNQLKELARQLNIKGFSTKTKTELSIMIGEALAEQEPTQTSGSLIFTNNGPRPTQIEELGYNHPIVQAAKDHTPLDYYLYASRIIASAGYAPQTTANGAGRIPTDGNFPSYYGVEPLDILKD